MTTTVTPVAHPVRAVIDQFGIVDDADLAAHLGFTPGGTDKAVQQARQLGHDIKRLKGQYFIPDEMGSLADAVKNGRYTATRARTMAGRWPNIPYFQELVIVAELARDSAEEALTLAKISAHRAQLAQLRASQTSV